MLQWHFQYRCQLTLVGKAYYFCLGSETVEIFFYIVPLINAIKHNEDMSGEEDTSRVNRIVQLYLNISSSLMTGQHYILWL